MASVRVLSKELEQKVACELWCRRSQVESDLCHHQNHLPDRLRDDGCGADNRAWMMSSRQSPTTMYRSWVWCTECSSLDVCGTLWTNLLPRTKNKATIEVFAGQPNEESVWETTTYCPSTRLVSRSSLRRAAVQMRRVRFEAGWQSGYAADCKSVYAGSIPTSASISRAPQMMNLRGFLFLALKCLSASGARQLSARTIGRAVETGRCPVPTWLSSRHCVRS